MTAKPLIVALGGLKRSGKDTFAGILAAAALARQLTPHRIAFADPLRRATAAAYALEGNDPFGDELKDVVDPAWGITRRQMLINVGEAMRGVDADHWTKLLRRGIDNFETAARLYTPAQKPLHIVTDLRRPNEAKALLDLGATLVLVVRDGVVWDGHETEAMAGMATGHWRGGVRGVVLEPELHDGGVDVGEHHGVEPDADEPAGGDDVRVPGEGVQREQSGDGVRRGGDDGDAPGPGDGTERDAGGSVLDDVELERAVGGGRVPSLPRRAADRDDRGLELHGDGSVDEHGVRGAAGRGERDGCGPGGEQRGGVHARGGADGNGFPGRVRELGEPGVVRERELDEHGLQGGEVDGQRDVHAVLFWDFDERAGEPAGV
jgi:hypothetical protein